MLDIWHFKQNLFCAAFRIFIPEPSLWIFVTHFFTLCFTCLNEFWTEVENTQKASMCFARFIESKTLMLFFDRRQLKAACYRSTKKVIHNSKKQTFLVKKQAFYERLLPPTWQKLRNHSWTKVCWKNKWDM